MTSKQQPATDSQPSPKAKRAPLPISVPLSPSEIESLREEMKKAMDDMRRMRAFREKVKIPNDETLQAMREAEAGELEPLDMEELRKDMVK